MSSDFAILSQLTDEDKLFLRRIDDMIDLSEKYFEPRFSFFLDLRKQAMLVSYLNSIKYDRYIFSGGYETADRKIAGVYPLYCETDNIGFPVDCIVFTYRNQDVLTHRDFLGSLMSLQIKRELVGDIIIGKGKSYIFVSDSISDFIISNIDKVGKIGVKIEKCADPVIEKNENFSEICGTVASLRLDCIVSLVTGLSREKSVAFISSNGIDINYVNIRHSSAVLKLSDVFSVRGYGKFILYSVDGTSKKGRTHITVKKYI